MEDRPHWQTLGWDEQSWGGWCGLGAGKVHTDSLSWDELGDDERHAAESLGYDEKTWREGVGPTGRAWLIVLITVLIQVPGVYKEERKENEMKRARETAEARHKSDPNNAE